MLTDRIAELERSHAELRGSLILAGRQIRLLNFVRKDLAVLRKRRAAVARGARGGDRR